MLLKQILNKGLAMESFVSTGANKKENKKNSEWQKLKEISFELLSPTFAGPVTKARLY